MMTILGGVMLKELWSTTKLNVLLTCLPIIFRLKTQYTDGHLTIEQFWKEQTRKYTTEVNLTSPGLTWDCKSFKMHIPYNYVC